MSILWVVFGVWASHQKLALACIPAAFDKAERRSLHAERRGFERARQLHEQLMCS